MSADSAADDSEQAPDEVVIDPFPLPPLFDTPIYAIQGRGHVSPLLAPSLEAWRAGEVAIEGAIVRTTGVVTAVDATGFYLQDPEGDNDPRTSDAIYVRSDSLAGQDADLAPGRSVSALGSVQEVVPERAGGGASLALPQTQLRAVELTVSDATVALFPTAVEIGPGGRLPPSEITEDDGFARFEPETDGTDFFEALEGMLVHLPSAFPVSPSQPAGLSVVASPDAASGLSGRGALVETGADANPERILIAPDDAVLETDALERLDIFAFLSNVEGVLAAVPEGYALVPTAEIAVAVPDFFADPRETTLLEGDTTTLTVATYALGDGQGNPGRDGAGPLFAELAREVLNNLNAPDIVALQGLGTAPVRADLEAALDMADDGALNASAPYASLGGAGGLAFLYRTDRVAPEERATALVDPSSYPGPVPPLSATFAFGDERVTLLNAAFTPREAGAPALGQRQPFADLRSDPAVTPGTEARLDEAAAVARAVETALAAAPEANIVVLGALEAPGFTAPIADVLAGPAGPLTDLMGTLDPTERYTAIEAGNAVALDHILASGPVRAGAALDIVHINSEFAARGLEGALRDPVVVALRLGEDAPRAIVGTDFEDALVGTPGDDRIAALGSDDVIAASAGDDLIDGGAGRDTVDYISMPPSSLLLVEALTDGRIEVTRDDGTDLLSAVERLRLPDGTLLFDLPEETGAVAFRLYQAAFGRAPDEAGLRFHVASLEAGRPASALAADFFASPEFETRYGDDPSDARFTELLYANALGRQPDASGLSFWTGALEADRLTRPEMLLAFSESAENVANTAPALETGIFLDTLL